MNKMNPWIEGPSQRFVDIVISLWTTEYDICIPFVSRMWHMNTFWKHRTWYELLWTPNVTYELLSINTECDKWIEDASRLWHGYLIESNDHIWNGIPIVWMYEHQMYEHHKYEHHKYEHQMYEHHKYEHHKYGHQTYEHPTSMNTQRMNTKCMNTNCMNTYGHVYWLYECMNTYGPVYHVDFVAEYLRTCIPYWCVEYLLTSILCVIEYLLTSIPCGCCWKPLKQCIMWMIE